MTKPGRQSWSANLSGFVILSSWRLSQTWWTALGCLYSLSCHGKDNVAHLVEQDVLTPLPTNILQFRNPGNVYNKVKAQTCKSLIRLSASCPVELAGGGQLHVHCSLFIVHFIYLIYIYLIYLYNVSI